MHPLCTFIWDSRIPKLTEKPPKISEYNKKGDPDEHVQLVDDQLNYFNFGDVPKCKLFALTLVGLSRLWFNTLLDGSIKS